MKRTAPNKEEIAKAVKIARQCDALLRDCVFRYACSPDDPGELMETSSYYRGFVEAIHWLQAAVANCPVQQEDLDELLKEYGGEVVEDEDLGTAAMTDEELHRCACAAYRQGGYLDQPSEMPNVHRRKDGTAIVVLENLNGVLARYLYDAQTERFLKVSDEDSRQ